MRRPVQHPDRHDGDARPGLPVQVKDVRPGTAGFGLVLALAARALAQDRYLTWHFPNALESHVLGAYHGTRCLGFLRFLIQVLGAEAGRPAVIYNGESLREGYVEALGVDPQLRRRGIGTTLQQHAAQLCRIVGCYQMRSRSPLRAPRTMP
jgi:GNAT superfamily N-acetyltransferase